MRVVVAQLKRTDGLAYTLRTSFLTRCRSSRAIVRRGARAGGVFNKAIRVRSGRPSRPNVTEWVPVYVS